MQEFVGARSSAYEHARARKDACAGVTECLHVIFCTGRGKQGLVSVRMDEPLSVSQRACLRGWETCESLAQANLGMGGQGMCTLVCVCPLMHLQAGASLGARVSHRP